MSGDGGGLLPRLGRLDATLMALDAVEYALTHRAGKGEPTSLERDAGLEDLAAALANLAALLVRTLEGRIPGLDGLRLLGVIRAHQRAHADLASLDDGMPFDA